MPRRYLINKVGHGIRTNVTCEDGKQFTVSNRWGAVPGDYVVVIDSKVHIKKTVIDRPFAQEQDIARMAFKVTGDHIPLVADPTPQHREAMYGSLEA